MYLMCLVAWFVMIYLLFPETAGHILEDIAAVFDAESANPGFPVHSKPVQNIKVN